MWRKQQGSPVIGKLAALRSAVRQLERGQVVADADPPRPGFPVLGVDTLDRHLDAAGLPFGALHVMAPAAPLQEAAATGFATAILACGLRGKSGSTAASGPILWCGGRTLFAPGLAGLGLDPERLVLARSSRPADRAWAAEEALRTPGVAAVVLELETVAPVISRRLQLAAEAAGIPAILLGMVPIDVALAAASRWSVAPVVRGMESGKLAGRERTATWLRPRWQVALRRCRGGGPGEWLLEWCHETNRFLVVAEVGHGSGPYRGTAVRDEVGESYSGGTWRRTG